MCVVHVLYMCTCVAYVAYVGVVLFEFVLHRGTATATAIATATVT